MSEPTAAFEATETVTTDRVAAYGRASGDDNAIHTDPHAASVAGLPAPVAHGVLVMGIALGYAHQWAAARGKEVAGYETRFVKPLYVSADAPAELTIIGTVTDDEQRIDIKVSTTRDGTEVALLRPLRAFLRD